MGKRFSFRQAALDAARAADDKKSIDIKLYDVRHASPIADYILVATVESAPHSAAVQEEMDRRLSAGVGPRGGRCDGGARSGWRVIDYGGLVVHLMNDGSRTFFDLERLWETARRVRWQPPLSRRKGS
jgi:ribosome-associated protein